MGTWLLEGQAELVWGASLELSIKSQCGLEVVCCVGWLLGSS